MDEDALPSSSHATAPLDSPLLDPRYYALKSSSPPPLFSENDSLDTADVTNYQSPREKRKRAGTWWQTGPRGAPKRRQFNRNFDSGVYMMSDDSEASAPTSSVISHLGFDGTSDIPSDPPAPEHPEHQDEGIERASRSMSASESRLYRTIQDGLDSDEMLYSFIDFDIQDHELHHLHMLNQIVTIPPGIDVEIPAEGQYRSMVPEIHLNLSFNNLCRLSPTLFDLQYLTSLTLRNNSIEAIPPQIKDLTNLQTLDLCYNSIRALPCELLSLCSPQGQRSLIRLELAGNPLCQVSTITLSRNLSLAKMITENKIPAEVFSIFGQHTYLSARFPLADRAMMLRYSEMDWSDFEGHHLYAFQSGQHDDAKRIQDKLFLITRTTASYYDHIGRLLKDCPALPMREQPTGNSHADRFEMQPGLLTHTSLGTDGVPDVWFDRPSTSKVPSLVTLSLVKAYKTEPDRVREEVDYYVDSSIPPYVETALSKAEENEASIFSPLRNCHGCGREYIMPRAEWIEGWFFQQQVIPIKVAVCSWGCVPDIIAKKPAPLKWLDIQEQTL